MDTPDKYSESIDTKIKKFSHNGHIHISNSNVENLTCSKDHI